MEPSKQELLRVILQYVHDGKYPELLGFLGFIYLPFAPAFYKEWRNRREVRKLHEARLGDKDAEIKRLADRIKDLENSQLKTTRRR
jgi:hypothetical protein